jgi:hypothetical protein
MSQNRRKFIRVDSGNTPCRVTIGASRSAAWLVNESIYGLCVGGLELMFLASDQQVIVEYESERITGRCRSAARDTDGKFQIGIFKSDEEPGENVSQILINSYIDFGGCRIVCLPIQILDSQRVRIRLMDGKKFPVSRAKVIQLTRQERLTTLQEDSSELEKLLKVYSALDWGRVWMSENDILDQEFGVTDSFLVGGR